MCTVTGVAPSPEKSATPICREHTAHTRSAPQSMRRSRGTLTNASLRARLRQRDPAIASSMHSVPSVSRIRLRSRALPSSHHVRTCAFGFTKPAGQWHR